MVGWRKQVVLNAIPKDTIILKLAGVTRSINKQTFGNYLKIYWGQLNLQNPLP
jgi:hypothetical protein